MAGRFPFLVAFLLSLPVDAIPAAESEERTLANDPAAICVLGQPDFSTTAPNFAEPGSMSAPYDIAVYGTYEPNLLYVSDYARDRVFCFQLRSDGKSIPHPDKILRPPEDDSRTHSTDRVRSANQLPLGLLGVGLNARGDLFVADSRARQVLGYRSKGNERPDVVVSPSNLRNGNDLTTSSIADWIPKDVASGPRARLYVADARAPRIIVITDPFDAPPRLHRIIALDAYTTASTSSILPQSLLFDNHGRLIVQAGKSGLIMVFDEVYTWPLPPPRILNCPVKRENDSYLGWLTIDPKGRLWVPRAWDVYRLTESNPLQGPFEPFRYALGAEDRLVPDLEKVIRSGKVKVPSALGLSWAHGMAFDNKGTAYISDPVHHRVVAYRGGFADRKPPDFVLGQGSATAEKPNIVDDRGLHGPTGITLRRHPAVGMFQLAVADTNNNRVMIWRQSRRGPVTRVSDKAAPFENGQAAWRVLGQPDFFSHRPNEGGIGPNRFRRPYGVQFLHNGLIVADTGNNRVLFYEHSGSDLDFVFKTVDGQSDAKTRKPLRLDALDGKTFNHPKGLSPRLVADFGNNRILYHKPGAGIYQTWHIAPYVFGQGGFFNSGRWNRGGVGPNSLAYPRGIAEDPRSNRLYVADFDNHRVMVYRGPKPQQFDWKPVGVIGQGGDFTTRIPNKGGVSARSLRYPVDVAVGPKGELYVADMGNHRVLRFPAPAGADPPADLVIGQAGDFTSRVPNKGGVSARSLRFPSGIAVGASGEVYVSDTGNNRVLIF